MMNSNTIFLSYCWANMDIADEVDELLQSYEGIEIKRDKRELNYGNDIEEFMNTVRQTNHVILLISEEYLSSVNCMYEVSQIIKDYNYSKKITPIIIGDISIYGPENRLKYAKYWDKRYRNLNDEIRKLSIEDNLSLVGELKKIKTICSAIDEILGVLNRKQYYSLEQHKQNNFNDIFQCLNMKKIPNKKDKLIDSNNFKIEYNYTLHKLEDISSAKAKRYSATIIVNENYTKKQLKDFILKMTCEIKKRKYYRNDMGKNRFLNKEADVVWLFIARDLLDIDTVNWICRTCWISEKLENEYKPLALGGSDSVEDIEISWNDSYEANKKFYKGLQGTKEDILERLNSILPYIVKCANVAIESFEKYKSGSISQEELIKSIQSKENEEQNLYTQSTNLSIPPEDLKNYVKVCKNMFAVIDNIFLYYSERGLNTWNEQNRELQMKKSIEEFRKLLPIIEYEKSKIN